MELLKEEYDAVLKEHFGYDALKPEQFDIVEHLVNKKQDVCGILATGWGKSICFQMPYLITKKSVIIISPLIALMEDQKKLMENLDIPVCCLNSACKNKTEIKNDIIAGNHKLIYITPEYLQYCETFIKELHELDGLALCAIDEAHCCSTWGMDFRPTYKELGTMREWAPSVPILAVTATASEKVRNDMVKILQLNDPHIVVGNFDRPNLFITVTKKSSGSTIKEDIGSLLEKYKDEYIIIYCKTRVDTDKMATEVTKMGISCSAYHAGMPNDNRTETQRQFIDGEIKCIVATIAFGMGINVPNVRLVIHYGCPKNMESYYQEIGRAGRDGKRSECHLIYSTKDFIINRYFLKTIRDIKYKNYQEEQIRNIERYAYSTECRRKVLLKNFGTVINSCVSCDNCTSKTQIVKTDCTFQAFLFMNVVKLFDGKYGGNTYVDILRGSTAKKMTVSMVKSKYYGKGTTWSTDWWKNFFRELVNKGYLIEKQITGRNKFGSTIDTTALGKKWLITVSAQYPSLNQSTVVGENCRIYVQKKEVIIDTIEVETDNVTETTSKPKTIVVNANKKWTSDEENKLINGVKTLSVKELAKVHGRTEGGIRSRLREIATKFYKQGKTADEIMKSLKLTKSAVDKIIASHEPVSAFKDDDVEND